jgi:hypothetical protein
MAGSLSSAIEILDAGVGQGPVRLDEGSSLSLGLNPEWETSSKTAISTDTRHRAIIMPKM